MARCTSPAPPMGRRRLNAISTGARSGSLSRSAIGADSATNPPARSDADLLALDDGVDQTLRGDHLDETDEHGGQGKEAERSGTEQARQDDEDDERRQLRAPVAERHPRHPADCVLAKVAVGAAFGRQRSDPLRIVFVITHVCRRLFSQWELSHSRSVREI